MAENIYDSNISLKFTHYRREMIKIAYGILCITKKYIATYNGKWPMLNLKFYCFIKKNKIFKTNFDIYAVSFDGINGGNRSYS